MNSSLRRVHFRITAAHCAQCRHGSLSTHSNDLVRNASTVGSSFPGQFRHLSSFRLLPSDQLVIYVCCMSNALRLEGCPVSPVQWEQAEQVKQGKHSGIGLNPKPQTLKPNPKD